MAEQVETPVEEKLDVQTPEKEVIETEDKTLLGDAVEKKVEENKAEETPETPEQKVARETKEAADAKAKEVPEKYDIKAPEGMTIDATQMEKLSPVFKELGLTNAQVQKLSDTYAPLVKSKIEANQKDAIDAWVKETEGWKTESLKQLGADAPKELAFAAKVINKIGTRYKTEDGSEGNRLRDILEETKVGNHPEITRLFIQLGKLISEDSFVEPSKNISEGKVDLYNHPDSKANLK